MSGGNEIPYQGEELDIFAEAKQWKAYWSSRLRPWIKGDVLEVGAGLGANTLPLQNPDVRSWHCLEPDPVLAALLAETVRQLPRCSVSVGTIENVADRQFDSIIYIDVLEHIEADRQEMATAARLLRKGGFVVVLSPAHQFLYSAFDASIGHYRRYNRRSLFACSPPDCQLEAMFYLDSVGVLTSLANRILLRQSMPTAAQVRLWDQRIVPVSRVVDPLIGYSVGKTICGIWERT